MRDIQVLLPSFNPVRIAYIRNTQLGSEYFSSRNWKIVAVFEMTH